MVDDDVGAAAAGELLDLGHDVAGRVVDGLVGAERARRGQLRVGRRRRDHARAPQLRDLDRRGADARAGRRSPAPSRPAGWPRGRPASATPSGTRSGSRRAARRRAATRARGAGTRLAAGTTTYSACPPCVCSPSIFQSGQKLSRPARQAAQRPHDRLGLTTTRSPSARSGIGFTPAPIAEMTPQTSPPGDVRKRDLQRGQPLPQPQIDVVHRGGRHAHLHLARPGRRRRDVAHLHHLGTAVSAKQRGAHRRGRLAPAARARLTSPRRRPALKERARPDPTASGGAGSSRGGGNRRSARSRTDAAHRPRRRTARAAPGRARGCSAPRARRSRADRRPGTHPRRTGRRRARRRRSDRGERARRRASLRSADPPCRRIIATKHGDDPRRSADGNPVLERCPFGHVVDLRHGGRPPMTARGGQRRAGEQDRQRDRQRHGDPA